MLNGATAKHLHEMRLSVMAEAFQRQVSDPSMKDISFEERFGAMVDAEWQSRQNNKLARLISGAGFPMRAGIEDLECHADRHMDKKQISGLALCGCIRENHNIIVLGPRAQGKRICHAPSAWRPAGSFIQSNTSACPSC